MINRIVNKLFRTKGVRTIIKPILAYYIVRKTINDIKNIRKSNISNMYNADNKSVAFIRLDMWLKGVKAGGAEAHTKGIIEALPNIDKNVEIYTTYPLNYIEKKIVAHVIEPTTIALGFTELSELYYNHYFIKRVMKLIKKQNPSLIYQRYGLNNYAGVCLSKKLHIPLILEYNGSEVWMSRNWGRNLKYEKTTELIEKFNFEMADLIIGNAESMEDELHAMGVDKNKILIVPNGVDENRYSPNIDGNGIRKKMGYIDSDIIVTFVGTFGPWHGTDILAKTIDAVCEKNPNVKYLFIGDGIKMNIVRSIVDSSKYKQKVNFLGVVSQLETNQYLAASNILVSPQVPNPDGTPFFGSPTKLFEYMAMGKPIVASNLDQIGRILVHEKTAILTTPGDVNSLSFAILDLAQNPEKCQLLGKNARIECVDKYTWTQHLKIIYKKINELKS